MAQRRLVSLVFNSTVLDEPRLSLFGLGMSIPRPRGGVQIPPHVHVFWDGLAQVP